METEAGPDANLTQPCSKDSVKPIPEVTIIAQVPQASKWTIPKEFWEVLAQVLVLCTIVTTQVIFWYMCTYDHRHSMDTIGMLIVFYICDLIYLLDTILRFVHTWKEVRPRRLSRWEVAKQFSPFILDVISLFPLEVFTLTFGENNPSIKNSEGILAKVFEDGSIGRALVHSAFNRLENFHKTIALLKLNRLLRLYRIPTFYRETRNQRPNVYSFEIIRLAICFACFLVLLCHSIACIWFSMNCYGVLATGHPPECQGFGKGFHSIYKYSALNQTDPFIWYLGGLHWSVMSLRNAGDPVLVASTSVQMLYSIITQFIGFYMSIMLLLLTTHIATIMDLKRSKFFHEAFGAQNFANRMKITKESTLMDFMNKSFNFMWKKGRGFTDVGMIHILPKRLRTDIAMELFQPMIEKSEILRTCFDQPDLEALACQLQFKHYFGNSFLIPPKAIGACMFYVIRGSVDIMDEDTDEPTILFTMGSESLIGEVDAFLPRLRREGVKTRMECDVLKLTNSAVSKIVDQDSEIMEKIFEIIRKRTQFGNTANAEPEKMLRDKLSDRETSAEVHRTSAEAQSTLTGVQGQQQPPGELDKEHARRKSQTIHLSPLSWLRFLKRNPKTLAEISEKAEDAETTLEQFQHLPDVVEKYKFVPIPPAPEHRWRYGVVSKKSIFADVWDFIVFIVALLYCYGVPVAVMLNDESKTNWIDTLVDFFNILDLVSILVVFYNPGEMIHTIPLRLDHIKREFKNPKILLPLIPIFSFHQVWMMGGMSYRSYLYANFHIYVIRLVTVHLYFRRWDHDVRSNVIALRMLKNTIYISIYIIFFSCIFCSFGCHKYPNCEQVDDETWVGQYIKSSPGQHDLREFYDAFYLAFYWSLSATFGIGYTTDDLVLVQKKETTLFTVHLVLSFVLLTYFFANVGAALCGQVENTVNHTNTRIALLKYLDEELTDLSLMDKVSGFMDLQSTFLAINSPNHSQIEFLNVSHSMFNELLVSVVAETLHKAYFFQYMNPHVLRGFCCVSRIVLLPPNVCLLMEGEMVEALHVIRRGYAKVYKGTTNIEVDVLSTGQSFGDIELIYNQPSRVTIRSLTHVELVSITRKDFEEVLRTADYHADEVAEMRSNPKEHEWFQQHFVVTEAQWRQNPYVPPPIPPQVCHWYSFHGEPDVPPEQDPYLAKFHAHPWFRWIRYFLIPCGLVPTGYLVHFWGKLRAHLALLQMIFVPMVEAYPYMKRDYMWIIYILDFIATVDMVIRAHTGYYERKTKGLVTHPLLTAKHYFSGPFLVDLYGSLPVYLLIDRGLGALGFDGANHNRRLFAYFLRMNRLVGVYRYWNYMRDDVVKDLTGKNNWNIACLLSFFLLFQTHFVACITIVIACPTTIHELESQGGSICYPNTWITEGKHTRNSQSNWTKISSSLKIVQRIWQRANCQVGPMFRMQASNEPIFGTDIYLFAFYYTATTSVGCGFGDFKPVGKLEQNITSFQLFVYMIVFTYALAKVAASRSLYDYKLLKFQQSIKYLVGWLHQENVDLELTGQILRHYDYHWMRTEGICPLECWPYLYPTLKKDVMYDTYEDVFRLVPEFDKVPRVFMREILALVQVRFFLNHEVIVRVGEVCEFIYIIGNGNIIVKLGESIKSAVDDTIQLSIGGILGSMDPSYCVVLHDCTALCWTSVDMFVIRRSEFLQILSKYPDVAARFVIPQNPGTRQDGTNPEIRTRLKEYQGEGLNLVKTTTLRSSLRQDLDEIIAAHLESNKSEPNWNKNVKLNRQSSRASLPLQFTSDSLETVLEQYEITKKEEEKARCGKDEILSTSVLPVSRSFLFLDDVCFWAAVISSGITGFQFAFKRFNWIFWILGFITDGIFILKMILRFFITYYDDMGDLISHVLEIEKGYMRYDGFIMDLFTAVPLELFTLIYTAVAPASDEKQEVTFMFWASLRLNRLLRLHFVWKGISNMLRQGGITVNLVHLKIKRLLITTFLLIHWLVVIFYLSSVSFRATSNNLCEQNANKTGYLEVNYTTFTPKSWVETKAETGHRLCSPYIMTLYFLVNTFTTTGYGDIYPITTLEIIYISILAIMSKVYVGVALTDVLSGLQYYVDKSYHISSDVVIRLYRSYGIPDVLTQRVKSYFTHAWQQNRGVILPDLLQEAPEVHRLDICFDAYGDVLQSSPIFRDLSKQFSKLLCTKLKSVWILSGDCIVRENDLDDRVYFVHRGVVEGRRPEFDENGDPRNKEYSMGTTFGEVNGITGTTSYQRTFTAMTNVDLLYLTNEDLEQVFQVYPTEKEEIRSRLREAYPTLIEDTTIEEVNPF